MKISLSAKQEKILEFILVLAIVTVISISTLSAANPALNPPGRDGGFFMYVGKAIKSGAKLYADIWDSKGPLIFWINALGVGRDFSRWGLFLIEIVLEHSVYLLHISLLNRSMAKSLHLSRFCLGPICLAMLLGRVIPLKNTRYSSPGFQLQPWFHSFQNQKSPFCLFP